MSTWEVVSGRVVWTWDSRGSSKIGYTPLRSYIGDSKCLGSTVRMAIS